MVDPDARPGTVLALPGNKLVIVPLAHDGTIQPRVQEGLSLGLTAVFMGITGL
jgi:hypothetical protein